MFKTFFKIITLTIGLGVVLYYTTLSLAPRLVQKKLQETLNTAGFERASLSAPQTRYGALRYKDIALDPDGFSTIGALDVEFNPLTVFFTSTLKALKIYNLTLTGEISNTHRLTLAGWTPRPLNINPALLPARIIEFKNAQASLLTDAIGGLSIDFNLKAFNDNAIMRMQGHINGKQKNLSLTTHLNGQINHDGVWQVGAEIDQGKIETQKLKITRMSGTSKLSGMLNHSHSIISELNAGGFVLHDMPWKNLSATIEGDFNDYVIYAGAESLNFDGVEITLTIEKDKASGTLNATDYKTLTQYLAQQNVISLPASELNKLKKRENISLKFKMNNVLAIQ